jgi:hypothetical protein
MMPPYATCPRPRPGITGKKAPGSIAPHPYASEKIWFDDADSRRRHKETELEAEAREAYWSGLFLRKSTLSPGSSLEGLVGFAVDVHSVLADTLLLQYRNPEGGFTAPGLFAQERESVQGASSNPWTHPPPQTIHNVDGPVHGVDGSGPEPAKSGRNPGNPIWPGF